MKKSLFFILFTVFAAMLFTSCDQSQKEGWIRTQADVNDPGIELYRAGTEKVPLYESVQKFGYNCYQDPIRWERTEPTGDSATVQGEYMGNAKFYGFSLTGEKLYTIKTLYDQLPATEKSLLPGFPGDIPRRGIENPSLIDATDEGYHEDHESSLQLALPKWLRQSLVFLIIFCILGLIYYWLRNMHGDSYVENHNYPPGTTVVPQATPDAPSGPPAPSAPVLVSKTVTTITGKGKNKVEKVETETYGQPGEYGKTPPPVKPADQVQREGKSAEK